MFVESQTLEFKQQSHLLINLNPIMAAVLYICCYIENWGRGTLNIIDYCVQAGLPKLEFTYTWGAVRTTFYKKEEVEAPVIDPVTGQVTDEVLKLIIIAGQEMTRTELMNKLELSSRANFVKLYLTPALEAGLIEMTIPDKPNSRLQKYRLTDIGNAVINQQKEP